MISHYKTLVYTVRHKMVKNAQLSKEVKIVFNKQDNIVQAIMD
jgi:hypothetical protein